ncbi:MAG: galactokinase [Clostridia bacterium]|nr:galactokinase [Clostridia bacterium]
MFNTKEFYQASAETLQKLYHGRSCEDVRARYDAAFHEFEAIYGEADKLSVFSVAGRSEISGNHTDHNHGKVLAASIDLDIIAIVKKTDDGIIRVKSAGFPEDTVSTEKLAPVFADTGRSSSLIRGVCDGFVKNGHAIGGFVAYTTSDILGGSGLSSSAAFEDMIGTILNHLYNDGKVDYIEISKISQYAENVHFGKPCGLMDQVACAAGGFVAIDFEDPKAPTTKRIDFDLSAKGYSLCIVNTGGSHANLTDDYAAVPAEMKAVAEYFGKPVLRGITEQEIVQHTAALRKKLGDRAVLRALHFIRENARVDRMLSALADGDMNAFLSIIKESGNSSAMLLQNYFAPKAPAEQGISLACAIAASVLSDDGAWRVHGGGFAGTMQAFVPTAKMAAFRETMETVFGAGSVTELAVRPLGAVAVYHA